MINKEKLFIIFIIIITLGGCGRKGDLLPPPNLTSMLSFNSVTDSK
tara:strand:+ start:7287 stop:7424 length:138 start_codon:yes stop_codon:yes gene_type:complete